MDCSYIQNQCVIDRCRTRLDFSSLLLWFPCRSCISPVPTCCCNTLPGPEWQPPLHWPPTSLSSSQSAGSVCTITSAIGPWCPSAAAGGQMSFCSVFTCFSSGGLTWALLVPAGHYSGPGGGAGSRTNQTGQLPVNFWGSQGPGEAAECRQR